MSRSRNIKPGFFLNDALANLPPLARLMFAGLWTVCDRSGRVLDRPARIKAEVLPYDDCDANQLLSMLEGAGFVDRYVVDGVAVLHVLAWDKHQNPHLKESASTLPVRGQHQTSTVQAPDKHQTSTQLTRLIPDSGFLIPDSLIPSSLIPDPTVAPSALSGKPARKRASKPTAQTGDVWAAYAQAYKERYQVEPVRNAKVNGQFAQLIARLGADESPGVARAYLSNRNGLYVASKHCVDLLLRDAEKLRTEWATGNITHRGDADQADRLGSVGNQAARVTAILDNMRAK